MASKIINHALLFSSIAGGSFLIGCLTENKRIRKNVAEATKNDPYLFKTKDKLAALIGNYCFPIVGTVSAAVLAPSYPSAVTQSIETFNKPGRVSEIMKFGFPGLDNVRSYSDYVLSYDRRNRVAHWVFEHLTPASIAKNSDVDRSKCDFRPDESVHSFFRSDNLDYRKSGFDRGHLAAAGNHKMHQKHCDETFYLTNMAPQVGKGFNRDSWNRLETYVRKLTSTFPNVYVCTGPLYLPHKESDGKMYVKYQVIGPNSVAVPTHFFKVIVAETTDKKLEMESYVMPNRAISDDTPLNVFQVPPETVERAAGLLFFDKVERNRMQKINGKSIK